MTPEQYIQYQAAMITGYTRGVGGSAWTYYAPPTQDGVTTEPTLSGGTLITAYVVQEKLSQYGQPLPAQPVAAFQWRFNAPVGTAVETGGVISNGDLAFVLTGLDTYQGWPTSILELFVGTLPTSGGGNCTGYYLDFSCPENGAHIGWM